MPRVRAQLCVPILAVCAVVSAMARTQPAEVRSVTMVPGDSGATLAIASSSPVTPQLQIVESPLRLVIDVPGLMQTTVRRRIPFRNEQIKGIRPPTVECQDSWMRTVPTRLEDCMDEMHEVLPGVRDSLRVTLH